MSDEIRPEDDQDAPELSDNAELSEQELDDVSGGGAQPHMLPPEPPIITFTPRG